MRKRKDSNGVQSSFEDELHELYYDPKLPSSLGGIKRIMRELKNKKKKLKRKEVEEWLSGQDTYTLHKQVKRKFPRNRVIVFEKDEIWSVDLLDVTNLSQWNDGIKYLLTVIDVFSKHVDIIPIKNKDSNTMTNVLREFFESKKSIASPKFLWSDKGTEFKNAKVFKLLNEYGIKHYNTQNEDIKACVSERFHRTFRDRLHRYLHSANTKRFIDVLPNLVDAYNNSYHRTIKMTPNQVTNSPKMKNIILKNMYGAGLHEGDFVRMSKKKDLFTRGYHPQWTEEVFKVTKVKKVHKYPLFSLVDYDENPIEGTFYIHEIQKIKKPSQDEVYKIEKILRRRRRRKDGKMEYLVKWLGYPKTFNSWVTDLQDV